MSKQMHWALSPLLELGQNNTNCSVRGIAGHKCVALQVDVGEYWQGGDLGLQPMYCSGACSGPRTGRVPLEEGAQWCSAFRAVEKEM